MVVSMDEPNFQFTFRGRELSWADALHIIYAIKILSDFDIILDTTLEEVNELNQAVEHHRKACEKLAIDKYGHSIMYGS